MSGIKNIHAAYKLEKEIGWGQTVDDGQYDLSGRHVLSVNQEVTRAQLNAGHVLVPPTPGRNLIVVGFFIRFNGTFTTATSIQLRFSHTDAIETICDILIAQAGDNVIHTVDTGTHTLGTIGKKATQAGSGLMIRNTGSAAAGGTSVIVSVQFQIVD